MFDLSGIEIGKKYNRTWLAPKWGYASHNAIDSGVIYKRGSDRIILFVTRIKQKSLEQFNDYISGEYLFWEGETKHRNDNHIRTARETGKEIHLFYREIHHSSFEYKGRVELLEFRPNVVKPSKFVFRLFHDQSASDDLATHEKDLVALPETERDSIIKARIGQGIFKKELIEMWGGACAVTGVRLPALLRASHIKPWRDSTNAERTNRYNGLLLLPQYDHLFDKHLISFDSDGQIMKSPVLDRIPLNQLGIKKTDRLRTISKAHHPFLQYHRESMFVRFGKSD